MELVDILSLKDEFSLVDAAALLTGTDPTPRYNLPFPHEVTAMREMLIRAIVKRDLRCPTVMVNVKRPKEERKLLDISPAGEEIYEPLIQAEAVQQDKLLNEKYINAQETMVRREDLAEWVRRWGLTSPFALNLISQPTAPTASQASSKTVTVPENTKYNVEPSNCPAFAVREGPHYAPKLAAALKAHEYIVQNPDKIRGRSVKQAVEQFLEENAAKLDLLDKDGRLPNRTKEAIALIVNTNTKGGTPKY